MYDGNALMFTEKKFMMASGGSSGTQEVTGKDKKRMWFESKYGSTKRVREDSAAICRFFSSSGQCRNGDKCPYVHSRVIGTTIAQPCRYLYQPPYRCLKGLSCHFSHDLSAFKCPHRNIVEGGVCPPFCKFDHDPIDTETARMNFASTYHALLSKPDAQISSLWKFYINEMSEYEVLCLETRDDPTNFFKLS